MRAIALVVLLGGCLFRHPDVEITTPSTGTTIEGHEAVVMFVDVNDVDVDALEITVDGLPVSDFEVTPVPTGQRCSPCQFRVVWAASTAKEGLHVIGAAAIESGNAEARDNIDMIFNDVPELTIQTPGADEDLVGVGMVTVQIAVAERGTANVELEIDGVSAGVKSNEHCIAGGCVFMYPWDTSAIVAGMHELHTTVTDSHGNKDEDTRMVAIDDLVKVTSIQLTGVTDPNGAMEIEVYAFDDTTNQVLGCAGRLHGLGPVDVSDVHYDVDAQLVNINTGTPLHVSETFGNRKIRFEVWEDDDDPICPMPEPPGGNDFFGKTPGKTVDEWKATTAPMNLGATVVELGMLTGRPLIK